MKTIMKPGSGHFSASSFSQRGAGQVILTGKDQEDYTEAERRVADVQTSPRF